MISLWTGILVFCTAFCAVAFHFQRKRLTGEPPFVSHLIPFVGGALAYGKDPIGYLKKLQKDFGNVFSLTMAGWNYHVFMDPSDIKILEKNRSLDYESVFGHFTTRLAGPEHSLHNQQKPKHEEVSSFLQRNKDVPQAIRDNLRGSSHLEQIFQSCVQNTMKIFQQIKENKIQIHQQNDKVKLCELSRQLIYRVSHSVLLGSLPDDDEHLNEVEDVYEHFKIFNKNSVLLQDRIPIYLLPETKRARANILAILNSMDMSNRKNTSDTVRRVLESDPNKENQIRHMLILLWAGQANTAPGLFWCLYYILKNPEARQEILKEFKTLINLKKKEKDIDDTNSVTSNALDDLSLLEKQDFNKLVILESAYKEAMRISGTSMTIRHVTADTTIKTHDNKQYNLRKGDYTMFYSPIIQLNPDTYKEPEKFIFDRYLRKSTSDAKTKAQNEKEIHGSIYTFGFGGGKCPGQQFASLEIKILILAFLTCFDPKLVSKHTPEPDLTHIGFGIMPPANDALVSL